MFGVMTVPTHPEFTWHQLPPFFEDADAAAVLAQRRYLLQFRLHLGLLVGAAVAGVVTWRFHGQGADWGGVTAATAFLASIIVRLYMEQQGDQRRWYDCRAAAESAKTLAWRYAVGGYPFPASMAPDEARRLFLSRLKEISRTLEMVDVSPHSSAHGEVNEAMELCRASDRASRIATYRKNRLLEQLDWYSSAATKNARSYRLWTKLALVTEMTGLLAAILKAANVIHVDLLGILSAAAASLVAWLQVKQHVTLAGAYSVTARELRHILSLVDKDADEEGWAKFVDDAEEGISREHTMWVASRIGRLPV
jgi:hypothetical protein